MVVKNYYAVTCPILQADSLVEDCMTDLNHVMQGKPDRISDERKICGVALLCHQCPARIAFSRMWRDPSKKIIWTEPREKADKFPATVLAEAFAFAMPKRADYRRVGLWDEEDDGKFDAHLLTLHKPAARAQGEALNSKTSVSRTAPRAPAKEPARRTEISNPEEAPEEKTGIQLETDMGKVFERKIAEEMKKLSQGASQSPATKQETPVKHASVKSAPASSQSAPAMSGLSLVERAKAMKAAKMKQVSNEEHK